MHASNSINSVLLGFLTFARLQDHGIVGGYLIVNHLGRPVEFHCSAPVQANRAQQILFGPTLRAYVCSEMIGPSLLQSTRLAPVVVVTDDADLGPVQAHCSAPILRLVPLAGLPGSSRDDLPATDPDPQDRQEGAKAAAGSSAETFAWNQYACRAFDVTWALRAETLVTEMGITWDLLEPIERIRAAISEAHSAAA